MQIDFERLKRHVLGILLAETTTDASGMKRYRVDPVGRLDAEALHDHSLGGGGMRSRLTPSFCRCGD